MPDQVIIIMCICLSPCHTKYFMYYTLLQFTLMCSKEASHQDSSFEYPKDMFKHLDKKQSDIRNRIFTLKKV